MSTNKIYPRSKQEDQRTIIKRQTDFSTGMISDINPSSIPATAVSGLFNAVATGDSIHGRKGTIQLTALRLPFLLTGEDFILNGKTLRSANGVFTDEMVGNKINSSDSTQKPIFVFKFISSEEVEVIGDIDVLGTTDIPYNDCTIRGAINASYVRHRDNLQFYLVGRRVYRRLGVGMEWVELTVIGDPIQTVLSRFLEINNDIFLENKSGIYKIDKFGNSDVVVQVSQPLPKFKLNNMNIESASMPSAYNYIYSYSIIDGKDDDGRRSFGNNQILETPGYLSTIERNGETFSGYNTDEKDKDFTTINTETPITDTTYNKILLLENSTVTKLSILTEDDLEPGFTITVDGKIFDGGVDFSNCYDYRDVARVLDTAVKLIDYRFTVSSHTIDGTHCLIIYNSNPSVVFSFSTIEPASGYNIFGTDSKCFELESEKGEMGEVISYLYYPSNNNCITHYSVYRSKDIFPHTVVDKDFTDPRLQNSPETFSLLSDVRAISFFEAMVKDNLLTVTDGKLDPHLSKNILRVGISGTGIYTTGATLNPNTFTTNSADISNTIFSTGSSDINIMTKIIDTITDSGNYTFTDNDIGSLIFWRDGTHSICKEIVNGKMTTVDNDSRTAMYCGLNPEEINYYDNTDDVKQNAYLATDPLRTRFFNRHSNIKDAVFDSGLLLTVSGEDGYIKYSDTYNSPTVGYFNEASQFNNKVKESITALIAVKGVVGIFTTTNTYTVNCKQGKAISTNFGEVYTIIPDPVLINSSIGMIGKESWADYENGSIILVTNEPAVRVFDGGSYTQKISENGTSVGKLGMLKRDAIISYDNSRGVLIWGIGEVDDRYSNRNA